MRIDVDDGACPDFVKFLPSSELLPCLAVSWWKQKQTVIKLKRTKSLRVLKNIKHQFSPLGCRELYLKPMGAVVYVFCTDRADFKWLPKVITWLRLLRLVIGLKDSRQFFNQWEAKPKPIAPCTRDFSRASGELQVIARNCDWFMELFVPVVIGRSNCFGFGFPTVIWKPLYEAKAKQTNDGHICEAGWTQLHWTKILSNVTSKEACS